LDHPEAQGTLMLRIAADGLFNGVQVSGIRYCVEFRPRRGWDAGIAETAIVIHIVRDGHHPRIVWSSQASQGWALKSRFVDLLRQIAVDVVSVATDMTTANVFVTGGSEVLLPAISVRRSLSRKFDLTRGAREVRVSAPLPTNSLRAR